MELDQLNIHMEENEVFRQSINIHMETVKAMFYLVTKWLKKTFFAIPWAIACQAPPSMEFPRQEHRSGLPFPSPGDIPDPVIKPKSPILAGRFFTTEPAEKPKTNVQNQCAIIN